MENTVTSELIPSTVIHILFLQTQKEINLSWFPDFNIDFFYYSASIYQNLSQQHLSGEKIGGVSSSPDYSEVWNQIFLLNYIQEDLDTTVKLIYTLSFQKNCKLWVDLKPLRIRQPKITLD